MEIRLEEVLGEEREGFYVQPMMKRRWAVQMDILQEVDVICRRHHIRYYGWYGTLLGAVRHQGFIPWDDDIDLAMLREDYERFQYFFPKESPNGWKMLKTNPVMLEIVNTDVIRLDQEFLDRYHGCPFIIGIDIFCLDSVPESKADEELWANLFRAASNLYVHRDLFGGDARWQEEKWIQLRQLESLTGFPFDKGDSVKSQLIFLSDRIAAMYWDAKCKEVTMLPELCEGGHYYIPKPCFDKVRELPFEDRVIPVLEDYDRICRLAYGDNYMTPVKGYAHEDGIKKQIEMLRGYFKGQGKALPECFTMTFE